LTYQWSPVLFVDRDQRASGPSRRHIAVARGQGRCKGGRRTQNTPATKAFNTERRVQLAVFRVWPQKVCVPFRATKLRCDVLNGRDHCVVWDNGKGDRGAREYSWRMSDCRGCHLNPFQPRLPCHAGGRTDVEWMATNVILHTEAWVVDRIRVAALGLAEGIGFGCDIDTDIVPGSSLAKRNNPDTRSNSQSVLNSGKYPKVRIFGAASPKKCCGGHW